MEPIRKPRDKNNRRIDDIRVPKVRELLERLVEQKELEKLQNRAEQEAVAKPDPKKGHWKIPFKWQSKMKKGSKKYDQAVVFYLNVKGELEPPVIVPIYSGSMIMFRDKVYEVDPRAFWTVRLGMNKVYKVLIVKEIDRRPVSNLDLDEIRKRGDATDSDEFLIKAALRAQIKETAKTLGKGMIILIVVIVIGLLAWFFLSGGNKGTPPPTPTPTP